MGYERKCLMCPNIIPRSARYDKKTCSNNCRKNLSNRMLRHEDWQHDLTPKASKALDELLNICGTRTQQPLDMFDNAMMIGNLHGSHAANKALELISDILKIYSIF